MKLLSSYCISRDQPRNDAKSASFFLRRTQTHVQAGRVNAPVMPAQKPVSAAPRLGLRFCAPVQSTPSRSRRPATIVGFRSSGTVLPNTSFDTPATCPHRTMLVLVLALVLDCGSFLFPLQASLVFSSASKSPPCTTSPPHPTAPSQPSELPVREHAGAHPSGLALRRVFTFLGDYKVTSLREDSFFFIIKGLSGRPPCHMGRPIGIGL